MLMVLYRSKITGVADNVSPSFWVTVGVGGWDKGTAQYRRSISNDPMLAVPIKIVGAFGFRIPCLVF